MVHYAIASSLWGHGKNPDGSKGQRDSPESNVAWASSLCSVRTDRRFQDA